MFSNDQDIPDTVGRSGAKIGTAMPSIRGTQATFSLVFKKSLKEGTTDNLDSTVGTRCTDEYPRLSWSVTYEKV